MYCVAHFQVSQCAYECCKLGWESIRMKRDKKKIAGRWVENQCEREREIGIKYCWVPWVLRWKKNQTHTLGQKKNRIKTEKNTKKKLRVKSEEVEEESKCKKNLTIF